MGKTTTIGKMTNYFIKEKKELFWWLPTLSEQGQLTNWQSGQTEIKQRIIKHEEGSDPAAVVFDGVQSAKAKKDRCFTCGHSGKTSHKNKSYARA